MEKLGIDLGSSSLGWFLRQNKDEIEAGKPTFKKGVTVFDSGMKKGTSGYSSPTKDRREARNPRILKLHKKYRKQTLLHILIKENMVPLTITELENWSKYQKGRQRKFPETEIFKKWLACNFTYEGGSQANYSNPYELRVKAIDEKLHPHEFGRALYHIVQRRGYKDIGEKDKETKTQIERRKAKPTPGLKSFDESLENSRTLGEALKTEFLDKDRRARNEYPFRKEYEEELETICEKQEINTEKDTQKKEEKNKLGYTDSLMQSLWQAIIWQQPLKTQKGNIGKCTLEPKSNRCPTSHPIFEVFRAWGYINTIKYCNENENKDFEEWKTLDLEHKHLLFEKRFLKNGGDFKFETIKKFLDRLLKGDFKYNYINEREKDSTKKYNATVSGMPFCVGIIKLFGEEANDIISKLHLFVDSDKEEPKIVKNKYSISDLWHILYDFDDKETTAIYTFAEEKLEIPTTIFKNKKGEDQKENEFVKLQDKLTAGYANLSIKAMKKIIPFLMQGYMYDEAVLLAKIPEIIENWEDKKETILELVKKCNQKYKKNKEFVTIVNSLIADYKSLNENERILKKDVTHLLDDTDKETIYKKCSGYYGQEVWQKKNENKQQSIVDAVAEKYQDFFRDDQKNYCELTPLKDLTKQGFEKEGITLQGELYHHSDIENFYLKKLGKDDEGKVIFPKVILDDSQRHIEIETLPSAVVDSIKNPMFTKTMTILKKLINRLLIQGDITKETEIIVELARELNDNNKRASIEKYQREREKNREKYRTFLNQYREEENQSLNVEENIQKFEIWNEQIFKKTKDDKGKEVNFQDFVLKNKEAINRYELWMEQESICMYTGKMIGISQLFSPEIEIEHTIPRSILPDNTMANKTVAFKRYNTDIKNKKIPTECPNYEKDTNEGTPIKSRLDTWEKKRDLYKLNYEKNKKGGNKESPEVKNKRIIAKHLNKTHYDYWKDKIERFTCTEIKDSWARRQLVDTQMIGKYARMYLKSYFNKVSVQKGSTTAAFRKIYAMQSPDEEKDRGIHTHHAIDAFVLTLIPTNGSKREKLLKKAYEYEETHKQQYHELPYGYSKGEVQKIVKEIEGTTLINNIKKDTILKQTKKSTRKRGKLVYEETSKGEKINYIKQGDTIRGKLFKETFIAKIRPAQRDEKGKPIRDENNEYTFNKDNEGFVYAKRVPIEEIKKNSESIEAIIDPDLRKLVEENKKKDVIKDFVGKPIRHIRIKTKSGRESKERVNYKSKHEYKNHYYQAAGETPWALMLQRENAKKQIERKLIPIPIHEIAKTYLETKKFDTADFMDRYYPQEKQDYKHKNLIKVGQKVFVLENDEEYESRKEIAFQKNRLYKITKFYYTGTSVTLTYHLEARDEKNIDKSIKTQKDEILSEAEKKYSIISEIIRKDDESSKEFLNRKCNPKSLDERISKIPNDDEQEKIKSELSKLKTESSKIENIPPPILVLTKQKWHFLYENIDFKMAIDGTIKWLNND